MIAQALLNAMPFTVVPVMSESWASTAHKSVIGASRFGKPMMDAIDYAVRLLVLEALGESYRAAVADAWPQC
jgi:hypothetical protein